MNAELCMKTYHYRLVQITSKDNIYPKAKEAGRRRHTGQPMIRNPLNSRVAAEKRAHVNPFVPLAKIRQPKSHRDKAAELKAGRGPGAHCWKRDIWRGGELEHITREEEGRELAASKQKTAGRGQENGKSFL